MSRPPSLSIREGEEVAATPRTPRFSTQKGPHIFSVELFYKPAYCFYCRELIWGLRSQHEAFRCRDPGCAVVVHRNCRPLMPNNCPLLISELKNEVVAVASGVTDVEPLHMFKAQRFSKPTWCDTCTRFVKEVTGKQGYRCRHCSHNIHKKCLDAARHQACTKADTPFSNITEPFHVAAQILGLTFAEVVILIEVYSMSKGMDINHRDGSVIKDCFTGEEMVKVVGHKNSWPHQFSLTFLRRLYDTKVLLPVLHRASSFSDGPALYCFSPETATQMIHALAAKEEIQREIERQHIVGVGLAIIHEVGMKAVRVADGIANDMILNKEIEDVAMRLHRAFTLSGLQQVIANNSVTTAGPIKELRRTSHRHSNLISGEEEDEDDDDVEGGSLSPHSNESSPQVSPLVSPNSFKRSKNSKQSQILTAKAASATKPERPRSGSSESEAKRAERRRAKESRRARKRRTSSSDVEALSVPTLASNVSPRVRRMRATELLRELSSEKMSPSSGAGPSAGPTPASEKDTSLITRSNPPSTTTSNTLIESPKKTDPEIPLLPISNLSCDDLPPIDSSELASPESGGKKTTKLSAREALERLGNARSVPNSPTAPMSSIPKRAPRSARHGSPKRSRSPLVRVAPNSREKHDRKRSYSVGYSKVPTEASDAIAVMREKKPALFTSSPSMGTKFRDDLPPISPRRLLRKGRKNQLFNESEDVEDPTEGIAHQELREVVMDLNSVEIVLKRRGLSTKEILEVNAKLKKLRKYMSLSHQRLLDIEKKSEIVVEQGTIDTSVEAWPRVLARQQPWFSRYFQGGTYKAFVGEDVNGDPLIVLLTLETHNDSNVLRGIISTVVRTHRVVLEEDDLPDVVLLNEWRHFSHYIISLMIPTCKIRVLEDVVMAEESYLNFERTDPVLSTKFPCGILLRKKGQDTEKEWFSNRKGSMAYEGFLRSMGSVVQLKGFVKYAAGLDVMRDGNGTHSLHAQVEDSDNGSESEIMFHVATMMPDSNEGSIGKKRYLGNNVCLIVFQEAGCSPFDIKSLPSHFIQILIIVQELEPGLDSYYRFQVNVVRLKGDIPPFYPPVPFPSVFKLGDDFTQFIHQSVINGHLAACEGDTMLSGLSQVFEHHLRKYHSTLRGILTNDHPLGEVFGKVAEISLNAALSSGVHLSQIARGAQQSQNFSFGKDNFLVSPRSGRLRKKEVKRASILRDPLDLTEVHEEESLFESSGSKELNNSSEDDTFDSSIYDTNSGRFV